MNFPTSEVICTVLGMVGAKAIDFFRAKRVETREDKKVESVEAREDTKAEAVIRKNEASQALDVYKSLVEGLRGDMKDMLAYLHQVEKEHISCREENAGLRKEIEQVRTVNVSLVETVKALTERVHTLETAQAV